MGALLAAGMFATFLALDFLLHRRHERARAQAGDFVTPVIPRIEDAVAPEPTWVAGYELPEKLHYHPGHTWVHPAETDTVRVGIDDFAAKLIGAAKRLKLPRAGSWLLQGSKAFEVQTADHSAELLTPIEGEVVEVNPALKKNPELLTSDPYWRGWVYKLRPMNLTVGLRNLLRGSLARRWTEDAREQLEFELMALSGSVLRDGGELRPGFAQHLGDEEWDRLVRRFFLS